MFEQNQANMVKAGKKNRYRFNNQGNQAKETSYKSKVAKLEDEVFNSLPAIDAHERQLFIELLARVVTLRIYISY